ncbi:hypothetical protein RhiirC2_791209 [Rhizophagus irregularis]|uniref:Uncharacterized protein n=1 Tax=Rhizophagus irregularis TaxID=588596 RepID=A0A2N1MJQ2_9GLOM|nr:hypothetical protein RhiirC2_791209 [Rhizophagus irregularis]
MSQANVPFTSQSNPTYDRAYFRNKALDQYPNLYREFSSKKFDYYGITDETPCPLCKLDHDDEEGIEEWLSPKKEMIGIAELKSRDLIRLDLIRFDGPT